MFFLMFLLTAMIPRTPANNVTSLMLAIENGTADEVKELLNTVDIESKDESGWNVLHAAAYSNGEITRLLMSHGADRIVNYHAQFGTPPPLLHACYVRNRNERLTHMYEIMEAMLKAGGDPNVSNLRLTTPLHLTRTGPEARLLISYGANVNAKDMHGYTPASFSLISHGINLEVIYALADGSADFAIPNNFGDTVFHMRSDSDASLWTKELVTFFAQNGVPLDALNGRGETALTKFLKYDLLLDGFGRVQDGTLYENLKDSFYASMAEAGVNLSATNKSGETLLHLAVLKHRAGLAKWLLENGANVEGKNGDGDSPLLALLKQEKPKRRKLASMDEKYDIRAVIDVLVRGGADVDFLKDGDNNAPYYWRKLSMSWVRYIKSSLKKDAPKK